MSTSVHGFYGSGFDVPGYNMKPIILVNMIIISATFFILYALNIHL